MAIVAVVDVALHGRTEPVAAKALAARNGLSARHLEPVLQALVRGGLLNGLRGPRGGYELARERRRISAGDIARAVGRDEADEAAGSGGLLGAVVEPAIGDAVAALMGVLDGITIDDLCRRAQQTHVASDAAKGGEFHI